MVETLIELGVRYLSRRDLKLANSCRPSAEKATALRACSSPDCINCGKERGQASCPPLFPSGAAFVLEPVQQLFHFLGALLEDQYSTAADALAVVRVQADHLFAEVDHYVDPLSVFQQLTQAYDDASVKAKLSGDPLGEAKKTRLQMPFNQLIAVAAVSISIVFLVAGVMLCAHAHRTPRAIAEHAG